MIANIKFSIISTCLALAFLFTPLNGFAAINIYRSPALQTIFNQAEATYTVRLMNGLTNQVALNKVPEAFAMCVGMTLQRQFKLLNNNRNYLPQYKILEDEALAFMYQLAKAHNYRHPTDGSSLTEARMGVAFYKGLNGDMNKMMVQRIGVDPANVRLPFMLAQVPAPKNNRGNGGTTPLGGFQVKKNEINLGGEVAPSAESGPIFNSGTASQSSPQQRAGGCKCSPRPPEQMNGTAYIFLDCNGNTHDKTYVECRYSGSDYGNFLSTQIPKVNGKPHGTSYSWVPTSGGAKLYSETNWFNGKKHGVEKEWYSSKRGDYLAVVTPWVNGLKHGTLIYYNENGTVKSRYKFVNNKNTGKY